LPPIKQRPVAAPIQRMGGYGFETPVRPQL
jgi:hypothetical protein